MIPLLFVFWLVSPPVVFWSGERPDEAKDLIRLGVRHIVTERILPEATLDTLAAHRVRITSHSGVRGLTWHSWVQDSLRYRERLSDPIHYYRMYAYHAGHILLEDPSPWLRLTGEGTVLLRQGGVSISRPSGYVFHHTFDLATFQHAMRDTNVSHVVPDTWLETDAGPYIRTWLRDPQALFDLPAPQTNPYSPNAPVWVLLIVTGLWITGYSLMPTYRKSQRRYWITHGFFVTDVAQRRIRLGGAALLLWVGSGILTGLFVMTVADLSLSDGARSHAAAIGIPVHPLSLFLIGLTVSLVWDALMLAWLHAAGARGPVLYLWPKHLLYPIVLVVVAIAGGSPLGFLTGPLVAAFLLVCFASFLIAVRDLASTAGTRRNRFVLTTAAPFCVLLVLLSARFLSSTWFENLVMLVRWG